MSVAIETYLKKQGDFCLGKFDWPIDVSMAEFPNGSRNAVQMPVLEKLGLVVSSNTTVAHKTDEAEETLAAKRYVLTDAGRKFYIQRESPALAGGLPVVHHNDFCAGKLSLQKVVHWDEPSIVDEHPQTLVTYTYKFAPVVWAKDENVKRVFPMLDRVLKGKGSLQLQQRLQYIDHKWIAVSAL